MKKLTLLLLSALCISGTFAQMRVLNDGRIGFGNHLSNNRGLYIRDFGLSNSTPFAIVRDNSDNIRFMRTDGRHTVSDGLLMSRWGTSFALGFQMMDFADNTHTLGVSFPWNQHGIGVYAWEIGGGRDGVRVVFNELFGSFRPFAAYQGTHF